ncbi:hypothetical protein N4Q55_27090, partial [Salmonella enterica subsp. enterica serovar Pomona]|uniref:hypothetical protein n=1 Tax=Salmonella enterica TaxID=28901 RepID=UPI00372DEA30
GKADLTNGTLNSSSGAVSVMAQGGDFLLGAGNISAANNITLNARGRPDQRYPEQLIRCSQRDGAGRRFPAGRG